MQSTAQNPRPSSLLVWLGLFVLSGIGGLIFQVVWTRKLALVLGSTLQSASLTSAMFMLGLGLGALAAGRLCQRSGQPLRLFAGLELIISLLGLGTTLVIPALPGLLVRTLGTDSALYRPALLMAAAVLLVIPALFMGATLPLLVSGHLSQGGGFVRILSLFYAANTLGAALGAFTTDFVLVKQFGVWNTACLAAAFDLTAAGLAFLVSSRSVRAWPVGDAQRTAEGESQPGARALPLALLTLSGFCGLGLEIAWTRLLVFFNGTDIYAYSLVLSIYLLGIVLGSLLVGAMPRRWMGPGLLGFLFLLLGLLAWQCVYTLDWVGQAIATMVAPEHRFWRRILACALLILPSTLVLGALFPLASNLVHRAQGDAGQSVGLAYIFNTVGSVLGALVAGFGLLTHYGLQATIQGFGSIALLAAVLAWTSAWPTAPRAGASALSALLLLALWSKVPGRLVPFIYDRNGDQLLYAADDHYGAVALVDQFDPAEARRYTNLIVDGYNMAGNNLESQRYTTQLGLLPALLAEHPRRVLMVCLGVGNKLRGLESLPGVEQVRVVELSATVVQAVRHIPEVARALDSDKVALTIGDGRYFLATTSERYDVITAEPPPPTQAGIVNLYSREYYQLCASRLNEGGVVAQWLPVMQMSQFEARTIIRAFQDVFPYAYLYQGSRLQLVLVGSDQPLTAALQRADQALPEDRRRLSSVSLDTAEEIFAGYLAGPEELRQYTAGVPPLTDDRPYLQYHDANWVPDLSFLRQSSDRPVPNLQATTAQRAAFEQARSRVQLRNRYHWQNSGDPYLDRLLRTRWSGELLAGADSIYDRVILGATPEHKQQLLARQPSWDREIELARWAYLNGEPEACAAFLAAAQGNSRTPAERAIVDAFRLLMLSPSPEQSQQIKAKLRSAPLSPALKNFAEGL